MQSEPGDGLMYLVSFPSKNVTSRKQFFNIFLKADSGSHIQNKDVDVKKVSFVCSSIHIVVLEHFCALEVL